MTAKLSVLSLTLAIMALILSVISFQNPKQTTIPETAYERVMRTSTLRCGFYNVPPFITVDPTTQKIGGMNYRYVEKMAKLLGLSVQWSEVLPGQQVEVLKTNRIDAMCGGEAPMIAQISAFLSYSTPIIYGPPEYIRSRKRYSF
ncbi:MAG: hypothetical protein AB7E52_07800 [Bdellovibrionales bacterium]